MSSPKNSIRKGIMMYQGAKEAARKELLDEMKKMDSRFNEIKKEVQEKNGELISIMLPDEVVKSIRVETRVNLLERIVNIKRRVVEDLVVLSEKNLASSSVTISSIPEQVCNILDKVYNQIIDTLTKEEIAKELL
jgi:hypothetical protein